jgi:hypothetical protein
LRFDLASVQKRYTRTEAILNDLSFQALAIGSLFLPGYGLAAPPSPAGEENPESLSARAMAEFEGTRYASGIQLLERAFALSGDPDLKLNIAVAYEQWGDRCAEALATYGAYFALCEGRICDNLENARRREDVTRARCQTEVRVVTDPSGAQVWIDRVAYGAAPVAARLMPGPHVVRAEASGFASSEAPIDARAGALQGVHLALAPLPAAPLRSEQSPSAARLRAGGWTSLGVGLVASAVGAGFLAAHGDARAARNRAANTPTISPSRLRDLEDTANRDWVIGWTGLSSGVIGIALGATLLYSAP